LTSNALMTGAGSQASQTVTTGTGVLTALGDATNATGGISTYPVAYSTLTGTPTINNMVWPSTAGIAYWTSGTAWGGAYNSSTPIPANYLPAALSSSTSVNGTSIPASATLLTNGGALGTPSSGNGSNLTALTAANITAGALANGMTGTTQTLNDNSTKLSTTAYADSEVGLVANGTVSTTGGSTSLTATQYSYREIVVTGALTSNATLVMPNFGVWFISNATSGPYLLTVKTSAGTGVNITQGLQKLVAANGTNVVSGDSDWQGDNGFINSAPNALGGYYAGLAQATTGIVAVDFLTDSIEECEQTADCAYGAFNAFNVAPVALRNDLAKVYPQYSTGLRMPFRNVSITTLDGGVGGYTVGTCTVAQSNIWGPTTSGYASANNGSALLTCTNSGGTITINIGQPYVGVYVPCVQTTSNTGWTVTIGGTAVGTACSTTAGSTQGTYGTLFSNATVTTATSSSWSISGTTLTVTTVASGTFGIGGVLSGTSVTGGTTILRQLSGTSGAAGTYQLSASSTASSGTLTQTGGLVNSTLTLTSTGTSSYLIGYDAKITTGSVGITVHELGEGAIVSNFFAGSTGMGVFNLLPGTQAMCVIELGPNDSANPGVITPAGVVTNLQTIATACQNRGASVSLHVPTPYNSATANAYAWIQLAEASYGQNPASGFPWDIVYLSDAWSQAGTTSTNQSGGLPNFIAQDSATAITYDISHGLLQPLNIDNTSIHPTDYGACLISDMLISHYSAGRRHYPCYNTNPEQVPQVNDVTLNASYTNATTGFTTIADANGNAMNFNINSGEKLHIRCHLLTSMSTSAALSLTLAGTGTPLILDQDLSAATGAAATANISSITATFGTALTLGTSSTATTIFPADYTASVQYLTSAVNSSSVVNVQAHSSTGTLTVEPGSHCWSY